MGKMQRLNGKLKIDVQNAGHCFSMVGESLDQQVTCFLSFQEPLIDYQQLWIAEL